MRTSLLRADAPPSGCQDAPNTETHDGHLNQAQDLTLPRRPDFAQTLGVTQVMRETSKVPLSPVSPSPLGGGGDVYLESTRSASLEKDPALTSSASADRHAPMASRSLSQSASLGSG